MKKILSITYLLCMFLIPISILYFNTDKYLVTATESMIQYLTDFLVRTEIDDTATIEYKVLFFRLALVIAVYKIFSKMIFDRKLGLSLSQRKGDWLITLWTLSINTFAWLMIYVSASFFEINTDKWLESFNIIYIFVIIGVIAKIWNTYNYYANEKLK